MMRKNDNYRTDAEFEDFLVNIGGIVNGRRTGEPLIFERKRFTVGNGWLGIIERLFETLIALGWNKKFILVKEKFGGMSIFLDDLPENGLHFVIDADKETFSVCEVCGESAEQHKINNWVYTLCDTHRDEKLYVEVDGKTYLKKLKDPILKGDSYFNALDNEILVCDVDKLFDPWSLKVIEVKNND